MTKTKHQNEINNNKIVIKNKHNINGYNRVAGRPMRDSGSRVGTRGISLRTGVRGEDAAEGVHERGTW